MSTDMQRENSKLAERIADLEADIAWLRGEVPNYELIIAALRSKYRIRRAVAKILIEMSDGKLKSYERLLHVCTDNHDAEIKMVNIYICYLRRAGCIIETTWGIGCQLSQSDAAEIRSLIAEVRS